MRTNDTKKALKELEKSNISKTLTEAGIDITSHAWVTSAATECPIARYLTKIVGEQIWVGLMACFTIRGNPVDLPMAVELWIREFDSMEIVYE